MMLSNSNALSDNFEARKRVCGVIAPISRVSLTKKNSLDYQSEATRASLRLQSKAWLQFFAATVSNECVALTSVGPRWN
jgi:hypothetical protein